MSSHDERRAQIRVPARIPVSVRSGKSRAANGETRDLSVSGIFLYSATPVTQGNLLEMVLMLPPELTQGEKRWVCCQAEVVRVEESDAGQFGIAACIRQIDTLPEIPG